MEDSVKQAGLKRKASEDKDEQRECPTNKEAKVEDVHDISEPNVCPDSNTSITKATTTQNKEDKHCHIYEDESSISNVAKSVDTHDATEQTSCTDTNIGIAEAIDVVTKHTAPELNEEQTRCEQDSPTIEITNLWDENKAAEPIASSSTAANILDRKATGGINELEPLSSNSNIAEKSETNKIPIVKLINTENGFIQCLQMIRTAVETDPVIAVDCEGDNLSRKGKLHLMSVATRSDVFLVDIKELKSTPFDNGFKELLQNVNVKKLMFDCREDSDALFHQFSVKLDGVLDIQLLEIIAHPPQDRPSKKFKRRCDRVDDTIRLKGHLKCLETYTTDRKMIQFKERGLETMSQWGERPLMKDLLNYAFVDVWSLFILYDSFKPSEEDMRRLKIASEIYVDLKRSIPDRAFDKYENNGYLPVDVIPEKGCTSFKSGNFSCTKCNRKFPTEEFSNIQRRNGIQKCRTCKRVKQDLDKAEQYERLCENDVYSEEELF